MSTKTPESGRLVQLVLAVVWKRRVCRSRQRERFESR